MAEPTAQTTSEVTPGYVPGVEATPKEQPVVEAAPKEQPVVETKQEESGKTLVTGKQEPKAEVKAEDIQVKLPEGTKVDEKFMGEFQGIAKELGLKSDGAQKLVDLHLSFVNGMAKEFADMGTKQNAEWSKALEADPDIGGSKMKDTALTVHKAVQKFGGDEFRKEVDALGLGNWPPLAKFLYKVGLTLKDDTVAGNERPASTPLADDDAFHRSLYDKTPQMFKP